MKSFLFLIIVLCSSLYSQVELGVDLFFTKENLDYLKGKRVALLTNHTGVNSKLVSTVDLFRERAGDYHLVALFTPEHGLNGESWAADPVLDKKKEKITVYSLYGSTRRATGRMLDGIDVIVCDLQDIGSRPYTYISTLFYLLEEAAKKKISVIVLDRPNPINGLIIDGPFLEDKWRSFIGYVNVPYCHGMTIGELSLYFNQEYKVGCDLKVISMRGWKREMSFKDTGLHWFPTSPNIPEADTPFFYPATGIMGEIDLVSIGIGYTLPFKIVGAPWIKAEEFASFLNSQKVPGVFFVPFYFKPFYGTYKGRECQGIRIIVVDYLTYRPVSVQFLILGVLKTLYPAEVKKALSSTPESKKKLFCQACGTQAILDLFLSEKYPAWKMMGYQEEERKVFLEKRKKYLLY